MSRAVHVADATGNVQAVPAGGNTVVGLTVTAGAAATVKLHHGTGTGDPVIVSVRLAAAGSEHVQVPAVDTANGLFLERSASAEAVIYLL